jgi:hypothetical protein
MAKRIPTRKVSKSHAGNYLRKSQQFSRAMHAALKKGDWDAVGLNAVHCAISSNDSVLIAIAGMRSASARHADAAELLESRVKAPGVKTATGQLKRLVAKKNLIEYEERMFKESEARDAAKNADRFLDWAQRVVSLSIE